MNYICSCTVQFRLPPISIAVCIWQLNDFFKVIYFLLLLVCTPLFHFILMESYATVAHTISIPSCLVMLNVGSVHYLILFCTFCLPIRLWDYLMCAFCGCIIKKYIPTANVSRHQMYTVQWSSPPSSLGLCLNLNLFFVSFNQTFFGILLVVLALLLHISSH